MEMEITIGSLTLKEKDAGWVVYDINELLRQLSPDNAHEITFKDLSRTKKQEIMTCFAIKKSEPSEPIQIIGMGSIHFIETFIRKKGIIEDVIVDKNHRKKGIGKKIIKLLIIEAEKAGANFIDLTSEPEKVAANKMYQKLGFKIKKNYYRLDLTKNEKP